MIVEWNKESKKIGLTINLNKSKVIFEEDISIQLKMKHKESQRIHIFKTKYYVWKEKKKRIRQ